MNADKEKALSELTRRNPFWVCFAVFLLLACNHGFGLANLIEQRQQLDQAREMQTRNLNALDEAKLLESRLQSLSLELIQMAGTNTTAKQIVQDFNIQWNPSPTAAAPTSKAEKVKK